VKVSILVPAAGREPYFSRTVQDLLDNARGDIEILALCDGSWPDPMLPADPRVRVIHFGTQAGMRNCINAGARLATGDYLMKCDAHCAFGEGYDEILKADCADNWVVVPRRMSLDVLTWTRAENGKQPIDAHFLSYPYEKPEAWSCGLHGDVWKARAQSRIDVLIDEEMSSQGSCWFMPKAYWERQGDLDIAGYGTFAQEFQEIGLRTWLGDGQVMVNKKTWYLHWHKGSVGRGYSFTPGDQEKGKAFCTEFWMQDRPFPGRQHALRWLIERFGPVPSWPVDLDAAFATPVTQNYYVREQRRVA
jgi:glycosyltransferase involved in cell wall biosynthesis